MRAWIATLALVALSIGGCASAGAAARSSDGCDIATAAPWIRRWVGAWKHTSRQLFHLPDAPLPNLVFFDSACVYTTSFVSAGVAPNARGSKVAGMPLRWWTKKHGGAVTLPNGTKLPVGLMSFADADVESGPYFVMPGPSFWAEKGRGEEPKLTAVFLHEISHTRQTPGMAAIIGPIDAAWKFPESLDDDVVQKRFSPDPEYVAAYTAERDLFARAAEAESLDEVRSLAAQAVARMRARHARWFTGENAVFATLDSTWLSMEGAGQWAAYAWLSDPAGGGLTKTDAAKQMRGTGKWWSQDEGLVIFLVVDRLLPEWPSLVFHTPSMGAVELLDRALAKR